MDELALDTSMARHVESLVATLLKHDPDYRKGADNRRPIVRYSNHPEDSSQGYPIDNLKLWGIKKDTPTASAKQNTSFSNTFEGFKLLWSTKSEDLPDQINKQKVKTTTNVNHFDNNKFNSSEQKNVNKLKLSKKDELKAEKKIYRESLAMEKYRKDKEKWMAKAHIGNLAWRSPEVWSKLPAQPTVKSSPFTTGSSGDGPHTSPCPKPYRPCTRTTSKALETNSDWVVQAPTVRRIPRPSPPPLTKVKPPQPWRPAGWLAH